MLSEQQAQKFLTTEGWQILSINIEIAGVQIDIIARDPRGLLHVIEVKSQGSLDRGILGRRQLARLSMAVELLGQKQPVTLTLLVTDGPKVWLFAGEDL